MLGSTEIIVLVSVGLILFGASAIPKFARSLGQAKHEFEKGQTEEKAADSEAEEGTEKEASKKKKADDSQSGSASQK